MARRVISTFVPTLALAATATVGILTQQTTGDSPAPRATPVAYVKGSPIGKLEHLYRVPGGLRASGWVYDPSAATRAVTVFSSVSGKRVNSTPANLVRAKVARKYPAAGSRHGFNYFVPVPEGRRTVCVLAKDVGRGKNVKLGCKTNTLFDYGPIGRLDTVSTRPGALYMAGWFLDHDVPTRPVSARITIDGVARTVVANARRSDVGRAYPTAGRAHGFALKVPARQGAHTVCVTAIDIGYGADNNFGCRRVLLNDNPVSNLAVKQRAGKLRVYGWAFDRDNTATPLSVSVRVDRTTATYTASRTRTDIATKFNVPSKRGFDLRLAAAEGTHTVCVTIRNIGYGSDTVYPCRTITLNYTPSVALLSVAPGVVGLNVRGWASDPDTTAAIPVRLTLDGRAAPTVTANATGTTQSGHNFVSQLATKSGSHTLCAVAVNVVSGTRNSAPACRTLTLALKPAGRFDSLTRVGNNLRVSGWAYDADSAAAATVVMTLDGKAAGTFTASGARSDIAKAYPAAGSARGFSPVLTTTDAKHTVCVTAKNVGAGSDTSLGCKLIYAVHPVRTSAPRSLSVRTSYTGLTASWVAPANDGGAPPTSYVVAVNPGNVKVVVAGSKLTATVGGLKVSTSYRVSVTAVNVAGTSPAITSPVVKTLTGPAPQTSPAPVSVSRYVRNIRTCSATEAAEMRAFGRADATRNPSGHRYMMLLDIGGQNQRYGGVVLSATTRFVTYAALLTCSKYYVDGYGSAMRSTAPATIAIGVNNDMDVNATTGRDWALKIVNPLVSYARKYAGITVAGANDIEPGFSGSYAATRSWLSGYLAATSARFVFNGSADGCAWTVTNRSCNNGWSMSGLYNLAAGMAATRIVNLPQVYNYTMADQWKYISLTGVGQRLPRINFGGPLTEVTACAQARSCDSIGGRSAWLRMWNNLQSHAALKVSSLPYSTDLRIDS